MKIERIALLAFVAIAVPAGAQNSDVGILFSATKREIFFGSHREVQIQLGVQGNYARQIMERRTGRLYLELPMSSFTPPLGQIPFVTVTPGGTEVSVPQWVVFVTPGVRYYFNVHPRIAVYAAAGAGIAIRQQRVSLTMPIPGTPNRSELLGVRSGWKGSPAFDAGIGVAFRVTRLLDLRAEFRAFRTSSVPGYGGGRNYPSAHIGFGFHF